MVIIFDNSEKYFSVSGLTNTSGTASDVKSKNSDTKVGGGVINIPVSSDDVLDVPVSSDKKSKIYTRDLFEQVKKNMNTGNNRKFGNGFMRIDHL